jgi:N-methylhydantoinase A
MTAEASSRRIGIDVGGTFTDGVLVDQTGTVLQPIDVAAAVTAARRLIVEHNVEALAVSLLWSVVNPAHEAAVGEKLYPIPCTMRAREGVLSFDLTGAPPQIPHFANSKPYILRASIVASLLGRLGGI